MHTIDERANKNKQNGHNTRQTQASRCGQLQNSRAGLKLSWLRKLGFEKNYALKFFGQIYRRWSCKLWFYALALTINNWKRTLHYTLTLRFCTLATVCAATNLPIWSQQTQLWYPLCGINIIKNCAKHDPLGVFNQHERSEHDPHVVICWLGLCGSTVYNRHYRSQSIL